MYENYHYILAGYSYYKVLKNSYDTIDEGMTLYYKLKWFLNPFSEDTKKIILIEDDDEFLNISKI